MVLGNVVGIPGVQQGHQAGQGGGGGGRQGYCSRLMAKAGRLKEVIEEGTGVPQQH